MTAMKKTNEKSRRGRPLSFNREQALHTALQLFWQQGYEGTSIADLVAAMGIAPPSLYTAFGSKEQLYLEVIDLYLKGPGNFINHALEQSPDAQSFTRQILSNAAHEFTAHNHPPGCIVSTGLVASATLHHRMAHNMRELRSATLGLISKRFEEAKDNGELPAHINCQTLARFFGAVIQGMSIQARDGALASELLAMADQAMASWPQT
ncbi:TetR/AcrR family transcriptional regulator [Pseudomonas anguilliseptica]|uniref:Transcriptional regulator, TetR family n=2 Tax=Pseudomonas anguilliseptica TaxID=53406 RepID=A0A1H4UCV7_PSEAG|nr:TetR/AcrR family transcriptional regulator [Pseudomonas anguilliseptica]SEC66218.1 transcriptional regulator, TetR family [Pseudomonas anguilliseptica]